MYKLDYLPIATQDMVNIMKYISHELCNPAAAELLMHEMLESADNLMFSPYSNAIHQNIRPLKQEFRKLIVKNYIMFYWIDETEKQITIARVLYSRRDYEKLL